MKERRFGIAEFSLGLLLGVVVGSIVGLMVAPRSGAEIRGRIANRATDFRSAATVLIDQAKNGIEVAASQIERVVGLQERNLRRKLDDIKAQLEEYHLNEA